jgi:hydroxyacylglutathione hydrolase
VAPADGEEAGRQVIDVNMATVGPAQENCFFVRRPGASTAVVIDPGDEIDRLLALKDGLGIESLEAILLTHTHLDHVGAVADMHRVTGAPVYCPELEREMLLDLDAQTSVLRLGPLEGYDADVLVSGGEALELAGITFDVRFTPGHSVGHVSYAARGLQALFSGDVLFRGSVGRVDLPGGDWPTLLGSINALMDEFPGETTVYPGHMGVTTLAHERATNPFLRELVHS